MKSFDETRKMRRLLDAEWAYLPDGTVPDGARATVIPGAYFSTGGDPLAFPDARTMLEVMSSTLGEDPEAPNHEAMVFDGTMIRVRMEAWYGFSTVSSMPYGGWVCWSGEEVWVLETAEEVLEFDAAELPNAE